MTDVFARHIIREKLATYNTVLDLLSQIEFTLHPFRYGARDLIYDQIYILESLIYTEMKHIEANYKKDDNGKKI